VTGKNGTTGEYFLDPVESGGLRAAVLPPAGGSAASRGLSAADVSSAMRAPAAQGPVSGAGGNPTPPAPGGVSVNGQAVPAPLAGPALAGPGVGLSPQVLDQLFVDWLDTDDAGDGELE
jgi:hypothetical protein